VTLFRAITIPRVKLEDNNLPLPPFVSSICDNLMKGGKRAHMQPLYYKKCFYSFWRENCL